MSISTIAIDSFTKVEVALKMIPKEGVYSGDYCSVIQTPSNTGLLIADSSQKGIKGDRHASLICTDFQERVKDGQSPSEVLKYLANHHGTKREINFLTLLYVDIDPNQLNIYTAGHPFPILYSPEHRLNKKGYRYPTRNGIVIGAPILDLKSPRLSEDQRKKAEQFNKREYPAHFSHSQPGDYLILFTDGVPEIADATANELKRKGLVEIVDQVISLDGVAEPQDIVDACLERITKYGNGNQRDDMTLMVAKFK